MVPKPEIAKLSADGTDPARASKGTRPVYFEECGGFTATPVFVGAKLAPGMRVRGPAIIEEVTTTTVLIPDWQATVDVFGNLILDKA